MHVSLDSRAHYGPVHALGDWLWHDQPCVVTGGRDGWLHAWTVQGEHLANVDVGEPVIALVNAGRGRYTVCTERGLAMIEGGSRGFCAGWHMVSGRPPANGPFGPLPVVP